MNKEKKEPKAKLTLHSLIEERILVTGRQVLESKYAKAKQLEEFTLAAEFERQNTKTKTKR